ncbi:hypothetical protein [Macrococcoides canis]|uniref:GNAT family N-acetyltransferase n=1 Tax=Macrococcoides canis TaxID=1855823 RepID=A0A4R6C5B7_9STAP|nr:hypothetical protein [Macrococcus canis]TDM16652.1 hypothetical protein ETI04_08115 [Macrococcus canis]
MDLYNEYDDFIRLGIELDDKLIGYADLAYIKGNSAELGIAIGESKLWGRGIGFYSSPQYDRLCLYTFRLFNL